MLGVIEKDKALKIFERYFNTVSVRGYVPHSGTMKFLIYSFLLDFVDCVYPMLSTDDYMTINKALVKLFTNGGCLMPYQALEANRIKIGKSYKGAAHYMGSPKYRITGTGSLRVTNEDKLRRV